MLKTKPPSKNVISDPDPTLEVGTIDVCPAGGTCEYIDICPVEKTNVGDAAEWRMTPARSGQQHRDKQEEATMIQALTDTTFNKVCIDSGAGESVCPVTAFPSYQTVKTTKTGTKHRAAGGQELTNVGEIRPTFTSSGQTASMAFQATTDVRKPLAAASKIAAKGNRIILDDVGSDSYIENKASGVRIPLKIENGVYMMEMSVKPFQRQA